MLKLTRITDTFTIEAWKSGHSYEKVFRYAQGQKLLELQDLDRVQLSDNAFAVAVAIYFRSPLFFFFHVKQYNPSMDRFQKPFINSQ